jgi:hypothetical protein
MQKSIMRKSIMQKLFSVPTANKDKDTKNIFAISIILRTFAT